MTEDDAKFLISEEGRALIAQADTLRADGHNTLSALTRLRRAAAPAECAAAWEVSDLRRRGAVKFGAEAQAMFFTRESLEQASGAGASGYHAARFCEAGMSQVLDLCGGIGGDALAFARRGLRVTLYENDPSRALFARANADTCGVSALVDVRQQDVTQAVLPSGAAWFDPARRVGSRRIVHPDDYLPSLSFLRTLAAQGIDNIGVKLSPAIDHSVADDCGAALEFLSEGGECKEALLWRGSLRSEGACAEESYVRATLLSENTPATLCGLPDTQDSACGQLENSHSEQYLYEPDPAVIRAHLIGTLARQLGARLVAAQIAYLVSDTYIPTPFAAAYRITEQFDYSRRRLQDALTRLRVGQVVIKKRGFPVEPDAVRGQLKLSGPQSMTIVLTRRGDTHLVFLCQPVGTILVQAGNSPAAVQ